MIELLDGLKTATLSLMQLRGMAYELVNGDLSSRTPSDVELLQKICDQFKLERVAEQSTETLAEAVCASLGIQFDVARDLELNSRNKAGMSEAFWRKVVSSLRGKPWVFICNYAENAASAVHNDVFGITYGFHENVTTWRGLVASGPGSFIIFYNTSSAPHSKMTYSSFARIERIDESKELDEKGRRNWKAKLSGFHMLSPVSERNVEIIGRNSQHGIQAVTYDVFQQIIELGRGVEYLDVVDDSVPEEQYALDDAFDLSDVLNRGPSFEKVVPNTKITGPRELDETMSEKEFSTDKAISELRKSTKKLDKETEIRAVEIATTYLSKSGWDLLHNTQDGGVGYDFEFVKDGKSLLIEVKGIRGPKLEFSMTAREFFVCRTKENFRLIAITNTLKEYDYKIHVLCPSDIFEMTRRVTQYRLSSLNAID